MCVLWNKKEIIRRESFFVVYFCFSPHLFVSPHIRGALLDTRKMWEWNNFSQLQTTETQR